MQTGRLWPVSPMRVKKTLVRQGDATTPRVHVKSVFAMCELDHNTEILQFSVCVCVPVCVCVCLSVFAMPDSLGRADDHDPRLSTPLTLSPRCTRSQSSCTHNVNELAGGLWWLPSIDDRVVALDCTTDLLAHFPSSESAPSRPCLGRYDLSSTLLLQVFVCKTDHAL